jgi:CubicO group peptidase (beta-lactamase class C family)
LNQPAEYLQEKIKSGEIPSAAWLVGSSISILVQGAHGNSVVEPETVKAGPDTIYDLASLTKPLITSQLILTLCDENQVGLDTSVSRFLPEFSRTDKRDIRLGHLLTHTSGLPAWMPLYTRGESIAEYIGLIGNTEPLTRAGRKILYSDLGYIALGAVAEKLGSAPLQTLATELICERLSSRALFRPGRDLLPRVAATEEACNYERELAGERATGYNRWREGIIRGEVHDQNAWAAGGVAGHAGIFGTAEDVYLIAREAISPEPTLLDSRQQQLMISIQTGGLNGPRSMAYRVNRGETGEADPDTAAGDALGATACGHNGFTGTSVWIDPGRDRIFVLLTNRVHPRVQESVDMNSLRREFHRQASGL